MISWKHDAIFETNMGPWGIADPRMRAWRYEPGWRYPKKFWPSWLFSLLEFSARSSGQLAWLAKILKEYQTSLLSTVQSSGDLETDNSLFAATTQKEGPVDSKSLLAGSTLTKCFPVKQKNKQKNKVRPIEDYKASLVHFAVTQTQGATITLLLWLLGGWEVGLWDAAGSPGVLGPLWCV